MLTTRDRTTSNPARPRRSAARVAWGYALVAVLGLTTACQETTGAAGPASVSPTTAAGRTADSTAQSDAPETSGAEDQASTPTEATTPQITLVGDAAVAAATSAAGAAPTSAWGAVALLEVKGRAPKTGYTRDQFGQAWQDVDHNGCDTRNDILRRDLSAITTKPGTRDCVVASGTLADPYSGRSIAFVRGQDTSSAVQIDHVVALSDAWQKGAQQWDAAKRAALGNDPLNLLAVDGPLNAQKGDGDTATWLPPNKAFRCTYVARQVAVKYTYGLWVTSAERDAMVSVLSTCPDQPLPAGSAVPPAPVAPAPAPVAPAPVAPAPAPGAPVPAPAAPAPKPAPKPAAPAPAPAPAPADPAPAPAAPAPAPAPPADVYYKNCAAARAAGAAPVHVGEPGYSSKLDRDGDGIGCES